MHRSEHPNQRLQGPRFLDLEFGGKLSDKSVIDYGKFRSHALVHTWRGVFLASADQINLTRLKSEITAANLWPQTNNEYGKQKTYD